MSKEVAYGREFRVMCGGGTVTQWKQVDFRWNGLDFQAR